MIRARQAVRGADTACSRSVLVTRRTRARVGRYASTYTVAMRAAAVVFSLLLTACATVTPPAANAVIADRLFCGRSIPGGGMVSDDDWNAFLRDVVTPQFPDGLTIWRAEGQWKGNDGALVREPVMIIEILHPLSAEIDRKIHGIAEEYRQRFHQDAVMRVTVPARMDFVD
jgi:hypothetical protein